MFRAHITQYSKVHFFLVFKRARVHQTTRAAAPNHLHKHVGPPTEFYFLLRTYSSRNNELLTKKQARIWQCDHVCDHQRVGLGSPGAAAFYEADRGFIAWVSQIHTASQQAMHRQCLVYSVILR
jgi:hypothetical protein